MEHGHEIGAHGCLHEGIGPLEESAERALLERQIAVHKKIVGKRPRGYRSPSWDFSDHTLALLEEFEFEWDSSLMGRDFEPYRPRPVELRDEGGSVFGRQAGCSKFRCHGRWMIFRRSNTCRA